MSIIDSYDESEEIVKAEICRAGQKKLPSIAITCFKTELIELVKNSDNFEKYSELYVCGEEIKIYKTQMEGKDIIVYRTLVGGPATTAMMEELHARGVETFIS